MKQGIIVPKEELEAFGRRVRSIREALRLKQNEFSAGLDLSEGYLCQIEKGKGNPTNDEILDSIDNEDESVWFLENSGIFRMEIIAEAKRYLYANREIIREDIKHERNKRKKTIQITGAA
jgi:transcriptional regulator with XRE-family HTH domain